MKYLLTILLFFSITLSQNVNDKNFKEKINGGVVVAVFTSEWQEQELDEKISVLKKFQKTSKISKANLNKLTKVQLEEKGRELGIEVDKRLLKSKIVNDVYKAQ